MKLYTKIYRQQKIKINDSIVCFDKEGVAEVGDEVAKDIIGVMPNIFSSLDELRNIKKEEISDEDSDEIIKYKDEINRLTNINDSLRQTIEKKEEEIKKWKALIDESNDKEGKEDTPKEGDADFVYDAEYFASMTIPQIKQMAFGANICTEADIKGMNKTQLIEFVVEKLK